MFENGSFVIYGTNGVCAVTDRRVEKQYGVEREYYVLTPLEKNNSSIFVPTDNETLIAKMRNFLSRDEITELILSLHGNKIEWERDNKKRIEFENVIFEHGDRGEILSLIRCLRSRKNELTAVGKRLPAADDGILKKAEKLIHEEFAFSLGISPDDVPDFIKSVLECADCT